MEKCPTCGTDLSEHKPVKPTMTLQQWFDAQARQELQGPLLTVTEACEKVGWEFAEKPICCGQEIEVNSFLGDAYHGQCKKCGKWIHDVTVQIGNSWMAFPPETVDINTPKRWIAGAVR